MYHEDKCVDGVWWWRGLPDGEWLLMSPDMLERKLMELTRGEALNLEQNDGQPQEPENASQGILSQAAAS